MNAIPGNEYTVQQWDAVSVRLPFHSLAVCVRVCLSIVCLLCMPVCPRLSGSVCLATFCTDHLSGSSCQTDTADSIMGGTAQPTDTCIPALVISQSSELDVNAAPNYHSTAAAQHPTSANGRLLAHMLRRRLIWFIAIFFRQSISGVVQLMYFLP